MVVEKEYRIVPMTINVIQTKILILVHVANLETNHLIVINVRTVYGKK